MLRDLTIEDYAAKLASKESVPGGGSAAAVTALLGCSLLEMSINLTLGKEKYEEYNDFLIEKKACLEQLHQELTEFVDEDARVFQAFMDTYKLPKNTDEEKSRRQAAIQEALKKAAQVPLEIAQKSFETLTIAHSLLNKVNTNILSDLVLGAQMSHNGVKAALLNTAVNIPLIKDINYSKNLHTMVQDILDEANLLIAKVEKACFAEPILSAIRKDYQWK